MRKLVIAIILSVLLSLNFSLMNGHAQELSKYTVKSGDTLWKISSNSGVTLASLKKVNNNHSDSIRVGEVLKLPYKVTDADQTLMAKLVQAEAQGEPYAGKVAVATVVLNRVDYQAEFPNNVHDVVYETYDGSHYAFTPVQNGEINKAYGTDSMKAVKEALTFRGQGNGSLYFYNPKTATSTWVASRPVTVVIGNHTFAK